VTSTVKINNSVDKPMTISLLADGTLTFDAAGGCVNPAASWNGVEPTHGAKFQDAQDATSNAYITSTDTSLDLVSKPLFAAM